MLDTVKVALARATVPLLLILSKLGVAPSRLTLKTAPAVKVTPAVVSVPRVTPVKFGPRVPPLATDMGPLIVPVPMRAPPDTVTALPALRDPLTIILPLNTEVVPRYVCVPVNTRSPLPFCATDLVLSVRVGKSTPSVTVFVRLNERSPPNTRTEGLIDPVVNPAPS